MLFTLKVRPGCQMQTRWQPAKSLASNNPPRRHSEFTRARRPSAAPLHQLPPPQKKTKNTLLLGLRHPSSVPLSSSVAGPPPPFMLTTVHSGLMTSSLSTGRGMTTFENLYVSSRVPTSFKRIEKIVLIFFYKHYYGWKHP